MAYLESNGCAVATGFKLTFERPDEVIDLLVVNVEVAVSRNPKLSTAGYTKTRKQFIDVYPYEG